jgi:hypothetical protein
MDACTVETCLLGSCSFSDVDCDDSDPCTLDWCVAAEGCTHEPLDGGSCDDGDACTQADTCDAGLCTGEPVSCDDGLDCTLDYCEPDGVCAHLPAIKWCAIDGGCVSDGTVSPDSECKLCKSALSQTAWTPLPSGTACEDDVNPCTGDACLDGECAHEPIAYSEPCYTGEPPETEGIGVCHGGERKCVDGVLGPCSGEVTPSQEICDKEDNNCDGDKDEGCAIIGVSLSAQAGGVSGEEGGLALDGGAGILLYGDASEQGAPYTIEYEVFALSLLE